ncbi:MAG: dicarboxylate/amino acid:cation symporter [Alphaproteobacteria bacterium]|jgi:Na+/H+-dicarboxylate symporter|nr:dicarboxylate/amino acid:cation symporter [Rickettsiaceae bacterium]NBY35596.1 dicarboxylate/amino acid:cation symporter [Alphaproteobacteria bacterium]HJK85988.1 dicarboxylate/amino acid:cation symporter [Candidatus Megaera endosymbiont of Stentor roeselii]
MKLWHKVTLGLILGIVFGVYLPQYSETVKPIGTVFLRLIQMIILPLIFFSLVSGITSMNDPSSLGRVGMKSVLAFLGTTFFAVIFGLMVAFVLKPGVGVVIDFGFPQERNFKQGGFDLTEFLINIVPNNIVGSFAEGKTLQVVFFAIFTGIILNSMGSSADPLKGFINSVAKMVLKMISKVVELSPYGAFALTAWVVGTQGLAIMLSLSKLVFAITIAMALQYLIFGLFIMIFCKMSPIPFYKKSFEYQSIAISTGSSKASLATTMQVCRQKLGVSESSTSFVLPLGASINMDGMAINLALTAVFFAQMMGIDLTTSDYMVIILTATLGSMGGAGIPGGSLVMLPMILAAVNMPIEGVAIIAGIDRVLDLLRTAINITGDATITLIIDNSEGNLNRELYNSDCK